MFSLPLICLSFLSTVFPRLASRHRSFFVASGRMLGNALPVALFRRRVAGFSGRTDRISVNATYALSARLAPPLDFVWAFLAQDLRAAAIRTPHLFVLSPMKKPVPARTGCTASAASEALLRCFGLLAPPRCLQAAHGKRRHSANSRGGRDDDAGEEWNDDERNNEFTPRRRPLC